MKKEITGAPSGIVYTISPITVDQAEQIFLVSDKTTKQKNREMVATCLNNADGGQRSPEDIGLMPYGDFNVILFPCLEINGLKLLDPKPETDGTGKEPGEVKATAGV